MLKILLVYKSGGEYTIEHVESLVRQIKRRTPQVSVAVLTNEVKALTRAKIDATLFPMYEDFPGWWCKMEMFRIPGAPWQPILYMDLDTVVLGDLTELIGQIKGFTVLRDFYRPAKLGSGLMGWDCDMTWLLNAFNRHPSRSMAECGRGGDQEFIHRYLKQKGMSPAYWQDTTPLVASYKVHAREQGPGTAKVVCFHGQPRPWAVTDAWVVEARA